MLKKSLTLLIIIGLGAVVGIWLCNEWVERTTRQHLFSDLEQVPENKVGLLLGTSRTVADGRLNLYFKNRVEAAAQLFHAGKVRYLIVSGDHGIKTYNEPEDMAVALVAKGIPDSVIFRDYAGFRTLDSVVRCKAIFGQGGFTVISQPFHNSRAVFIARQKGLSAVGFNARDVSLSVGAKTMLREYLARVKTILDLYLLGKEPRFYGEQIEIP